jgi:hypothetical protein
MDLQPVFAPDMEPITTPQRDPRTMTLPNRGLRYRQVFSINHTRGELLASRVRLSEEQSPHPNGPPTDLDNRACQA